MFDRQPPVLFTPQDQGFASNFAIERFDFIREAPVKLTDLAV